MPKMRNGHCSAVVALIFSGCSPSVSNQNDEVRGNFEGVMIARTTIVVYMPQRTQFPVQLAAINSCSGDCGSKLTKLVKYYDNMREDVCGFRISAAGNIKIYSGKRFFVPTKIGSVVGYRIANTPHLSGLIKKDTPCDLS